MPPMGVDMVTHMKTTIDLADALFLEVKDLSERRKTTFRAIVEAALRRFLAQEREARSAFRLRDAAVHGQGLQPGLSEGNWGQLRALIYEEHGG